MEIKKSPRHNIRHEREYTYMLNTMRSFKKKSNGIKPVICVHQWLTKVFIPGLTLIPLISSIYSFSFSIILNAMINIVD